jgi:hypothetical protein
MQMATNGLDKRYNIRLFDGRTMSVKIVEENTNYIKVANRKGFTSILHKSLISELFSINLTPEPLE